MVSSDDVTLERYDLVERLASGGMGEVFRAVAHGAHGFSKDLAVKRILPSLARDRGFEKRFITEAKLAVTMTHANIVSVHDFGHMDGSLYLAMEFVDGVDLARLLSNARQNKSELPLPAIVHLAGEICKGLDFAHRRDVIHRDISPSNVLLSRAGEVKIADFGIARAVSGNTSQVDGERIVGKLRYMSPEQIAGEAIDARSDIFSLGVVLWELTTGRRLFSGRNLEDATEQICTMPIPLLSAERPEVSSGFNEAVARMLKRDPDDRWASAGALLRVLAKCAYSIDPIPTAVDVAEIVENALQGDDDELDAALLGQLGIGDDIPQRITKARSRSKNSASASPTRSLVRTGHNVRGVPQWQTASTLLGRPAESVEAEGAKAGTPEGTIDVASGTRDDPPVPRSRSRWVLLGGMLAAASVTAVILTLVRGSSKPPPESKPEMVETTGAGSAIEPTQQAADDAAPPIQADATVTKLMVSIESSPSGAKVSVNGEAVGVTPLEIQQAPGAVEVVLSKSGFKTVSKTADISVNNTDIRVRLKRDEGTVSIFSHPWAFVYYRGRKVGQTPIANLKLPSGSHRLVLENPVLKLKKRVTVKVPRKAPYKFSLQ